MVDYKNCLKNFNNVTNLSTKWGEDFVRHRLNILVKSVADYELVRVNFKHGKFDYFLII